MKQNEHHFVFDYDQAFSRNIGWVTEEEQLILRNKKIAIAGMGGVGGSHLLTLVRLGIENFHIADSDTFELSNFNRQIGARVDTIGDHKSDVLAGMAYAINPNIKLKIFPQNVTELSMDDFFKDIDLFIDAIDFYAIEIREKIYRKISALQIPCIVAAPLGMSCAYVIYMPGHMLIEDYFQFKSCQDEFDKTLNFIIGLNPTLSCGQYLVVPSTINLTKKSGPSLSVSCILCSGIVGTEVIKILLDRRHIYSLPYYNLFDAYLCKYVRGFIPFGNRNPIQWIKRYFLKRKLATYKYQSGP